MRRSPGEHDGGEVGRPVGAPAAVAVPGVIEVAQVQASRSLIDQATRDGAPRAWRRHLCLLLDGFRAERAPYLPEPQLTGEQAYRAMIGLNGTCTSHWRPPGLSRSRPHGARRPTSGTYVQQCSRHEPCRRGALAPHVTEALAQVPHRLLALGVGSDEDQLLDGFRITDAVGVPHPGNRHAGVLGRVITSKDLPWSATGRSHRRVG